MPQRKFGREFKIEAVRLIKESLGERGPGVARSGRTRERSAQLGQVREDRQLVIAIGGGDIAPTPSRLEAVLAH